MQITDTASEEITIFGKGDIMQQSRTIKRRYSTLIGTIFIFVLLLLCTGTAYADTVAEGTCGENLTWNLDDEGTLTISGTGAMDDYVVNSDTTISCPWYAYRKDIIKIVASDGVTTVGKRSFDGCTRLTDVHLPDGLTTIGWYAFYGCTSLSEFPLPDGLTIIEQYAFYGCKIPTELHLPNWLTTIGGYAFSDCTGLTDVTLPDGLTTIDGYAFRNCTGITEFHLPDGLATIGAGVFSGCTNLSGLKLPNELTTISAGVFSGCINLTELNLPDGITTIGEGAFRNCTSLTELNFPDGLTSLGRYAFYGCTNLTELILPDGVTIPGDGAGVFYGCTNLSELHLPDQITTIGYMAFYKCTSLTKVDLPDRLTTIGTEAFRGCTSLTELRIPDGLTSIGDGAFNGCYSLEIIKTDNYAHWCSRDIAYSGILFQTKARLVAEEETNEVVLPEGITTIPYGTFRGNDKLTSIQLPKSLETVEAEAFDGCEALKEVEVNDLNKWCRIDFQSGTSNPLTASSNAILQLRGGTGSKVNLPEGITAIPDGSFRGWDMLSEVTLPASLQQIGAGAFAGCKGINTVNVSGLDNWLAIDFKTEDSSPLAGGTAELRIWNGSDYKSLAKETISNTTWSIPAYAFSGSKSLQTIVIPDGVTRIGTGAFASCTGLREVTIPETVEALEEKTFSGCGDLHKILIPETVTRIENDAFSRHASDLIIYGYEGSEAERYAVDQGITFLPYTEYNEIRTGTITENIRWTLTGGTTLTIEGEGDVPVYAGGESPLAAIANKVREVRVKGVTGLGDYLFQDFTDLKRVDVSLETDLGQIGANTFSGCGDVEIRCYPNCFSTVSGIVAAEPALSGVTVTKRSGSRAGNVTWMYNENTGTILLTSNGSSEFGAESEELSFWELNARRVEFSENFSCKDIPDDLFKDCTTITEIHLSPKITTIGAECFKGCTNLKTLTWYENVESIGEGAFENCRNLKGIYISGDGMIDENERQVSEETIEIPEKVLQIPASAFKNCSAVSVIDWYEDPENNSGGGTIGAEAFSGCSTMKEFWVPDHVKAVGSSAFRNCGSLEDMAFAEGLKILGSEAFYGCSKISEMTFEADLQQIGSRAIGYYEDDNGQAKANPSFRAVAPEDASVIKRYCNNNGLSFVTTAGIGGGHAEGQIYVKIAGSTTVKKNKTKKLKFKTDGKVKKVSSSGTGGVVSVTRAGKKVKFKGLRAGKVKVNLAFKMKNGETKNKSVTVTVKKSSASIEDAAAQSITADKKALTFAWYHAAGQKIQVKGVETSLGCNLSKTGIVKVSKTQKDTSATVTVTPLKAGKVTLTMSAPGDDEVFAPSNQIKITITVKAQPKTVTAKVKKLSKTKARVSWGKIAGASSYQVQVAVKKNFKGKKTYNVKSGTLKKTVKITKGKKNYIRVRYKCNGKYSKWGKTLVVKK